MTGIMGIEVYVANTVGFQIGSKREWRRFLIELVQKKRDLIDRARYSDQCLQLIFVDQAAEAAKYDCLPEDIDWDEWLSEKCRKTDVDSDLQRLFAHLYDLDWHYDEGLFGCRVLSVSGKWEGCNTVPITEVIEAIAELQQFKDSHSVPYDIEFGCSFSMS